MIYITGDTHGSQARLSRETMPFADRWTKRDTLIICGDFGYLFNGGPKEELALRELSFRPYTIAFVDGNHENYNLLANYPAIAWRGGMARRIRRNVWRQYHPWRRSYLLFSIRLGIRLSDLFEIPDLQSGTQRRHVRVFGGTVQPGCPALSSPLPPDHDGHQ